MWREWQTILAEALVMFVIGAGCIAWFIILGSVTQPPF